MRTAIKFSVLSQPGIANSLILDHAFDICGLPAEGNLSDKIINYVNGKFSMRKHLTDYLDREAKCAYFLWQKEVASPTFDGIGLFKPMAAKDLEHFPMFCNSIFENKSEFIDNASLLDPDDPRLPDLAVGSMGLVVSSIKDALDGDIVKRTYPSFLSWVSSTTLFPESATVCFPPIIVLLKCLIKMGLVNMRLIINFAKNGDTGKTTLKELISPRAYSFILTVLSFTLVSDYDFSVMNFRDCLLNDERFIASMKAYNKLAKRDYEAFSEENNASNNLFLHILFQMIIYSGISTFAVHDDDDALDEVAEEPEAGAGKELDTFLVTGISLISTLISVLISLLINVSHYTNLCTN